MEPTLEQTRYARGLAKLVEVAGPAGEQVAAPLGDLGRYIVEFVYGDIYRRDGLSLRQREQITVAVLTALGREPQLRVHLGTALRAGLSVADLEETIIQTVPFAGFPTAINALTLLEQLVADAPLAGQESPVQDGLASSLPSSKTA
jgi:4-carboxymuconolactone decarboxylase